MHRDLAGFDFAVSQVERKLVTQLAGCEFTAAAHNAVLVGGPGTGKSRLATAIRVAGLTEHGKRARFYSTVDLVNALEREKAEGKVWRIAGSFRPAASGHRDPYQFFDMSPTATLVSSRVSGSLEE